MPLTLSSVTTNGCLRLLEEVALPQRLLPGDTLELSATVESAGTTLQSAGITLRTDAEDGTSAEFNYPLNAFFTGPSMITMEASFGGTGSIIA